MSLIIPPQPTYARFAVAGMTAVLLGACSPDMERFGAVSDPTPVGTTLVPPSAIAGSSSLVPGNIPASGIVPKVPVGAVTASALPAVASARTVIPASRAVGSGARFAAPAVKSPQIAKQATSRVATSQFPTGTARNLTNHGRWTPAGGSTVAVGQGENLKTLERRYGIPSKTLLKVNGFSSASQVKPGSKVVIPVYNAKLKKGSVTAKARLPAKADTVASIRPVSRTVVKPQRLAVTRPVSAIVPPARPTALRARKVTRTERTKPVQQRLASRVPLANARPVYLNKRSAPVARSVKRPVRETAAERRARLRAARTEARKQAQAEKRLAKQKRTVEQARDDRKSLASRKALAKKKARAEKKELAARKALAAKKALAEKKAAAKKSRLASLSRKDRKPVRQIPLYKRQKTASARNDVDTNPVGSIKRPASGNFRWPARGRIIQGFKKGRNDGINIAVPEGTSIKAAQGGVVAYAGSELKGYGNLVLVRHSNGYVSAYAHNSQLKVKRGDKVRRGQTIAKAGRTGNVSTPQLHFELRKGANPVNPVKLLGSN